LKCCQKLNQDNYSIIPTHLLIKRSNRWRNILNQYKYKGKQDEIIKKEKCNLIIIHIIYLVLYQNLIIIMTLDINNIKKIKLIINQKRIEKAIYPV